MQGSVFHWLSWGPHRDYTTHTYIFGKLCISAIQPAIVNKNMSSISCYNSQVKNRSQFRICADPAFSGPYLRVDFTYSFPIYTILKPFQCSFQRSLLGFNATIITGPRTCQIPLPSPTSCPRRVSNGEYRRITSGSGGNLYIF